jgi:hypothetical protein
VSGKGGRKTEKADARGGGFFLLPHCVLGSEAFRTASPRAVKLLIVLCAKHNGFNNGAIGLGFRELAELMDSRNNAANSRALCQLIERGFVALEVDHPRGKRLAREYRLTFVPTADGAATNDYLAWREGDAGTCRKRSQGNFRVEPTETRSAPRVEDTETGEETSRFDNSNGVHAKLPFLGPSRVSVTSTHIGNHLGGSSSSPVQSSKSPCSVNGPLSAAPDPEELRGRVLAVLGETQRGTQGQLAAIAAIRPAALSKYLSGDGSLNDAARIRLTMALPKVATACAA